MPWKCGGQDWTSWIHWRKCRGCSKEEACETPSGEDPGSHHGCDAEADVPATSSCSLWNTKENFAWSIEWWKKSGGRWKTQQPCHAKCWWEYHDGVYFTHAGSWLWVELHRHSVARSPIFQGTRAVAKTACLPVLGAGDSRIKCHILWERGWEKWWSPVKAVGTSTLLDSVLRWKSIAPRRVFSMNKCFSSVNPQRGKIHATESSYKEVMSSEPLIRGFRPASISSVAKLGSPRPPPSLPPPQSSSKPNHWPQKCSKTSHSKNGSCEWILLCAFQEPHFLPPTSVMLENGPAVLFVCWKCAAHWAKYSRVHSQEIRSCL